MSDLVKGYYAKGEERDRLTTPRGQVEFERTKEIVLRRRPDAPSTVADIGGGAGPYALWLAGRGHLVEHRDLMPLHVQQLEAAADGNPLVRTAVGDARELDLPDRSVDAVLLLGPLYHLPRRADRVRALEEAWRVLRPGGPVFAAAISRWAPRLDGEFAQRLYERDERISPLIPDVERTGWMPPLFDGSFSAFCHRPGQLRAELRSAGFQDVDLVGVEGPGFLMHDLAERLADPLGRTVVFETARAFERVPELLGLSPHLIATGNRPA
ncbi:class I SAM-dependent methyltransferase [Actinomadura sp. KC216]|uniref:class I SAM-dependent methyltransferase n=1 Tax=Actinomadura sp. KC216 TaxID=2530370 RepID=UPI00140460F4|nr:class I SAM-dependent methyltransferase [Actinomadura sp. KC216]